jgi:hypothetical protein
MASITIIRVTTVNNKSMRRIMRYPLSLEGGLGSPPVLRNRITMMGYKGWRNFRVRLMGEVRGIHLPRRWLTSQASQSPYHQTTHRHVDERLARSSAGADRFPGAGVLKGLRPVS